MAEMCTVDAGRNKTYSLAFSEPNSSFTLIVFNNSCHLWSKNRNYQHLGNKPTLLDETLSFFSLVLSKMFAAVEQNCFYYLIVECIIIRFSHKSSNMIKLNIKLQFISIKDSINTSLLVLDFWIDLITVMASTQVFSWVVWNSVTFPYCWSQANK